MEEMVKDLFEGFYKGRRVLVTGHTGFKGSWLCLWLWALGANVAGYALDPESGEGNFAATGLSALVDDFRGDIRDVAKLAAAFAEFQPQVVFHLAAQPLVRASYDDPRYTYDVNLMGTLAVLEAIRKTDSVTSAVLVTTDKVYENDESGAAYVEDHPLGGHDPYSSSKACCEILVSSYRRSFLIPAATARAGNVFGGGDWGKDRIVPDCVRALREGRAIDVRHPEAVRPWQYVLEPLYGYLLLAKAIYDGAQRGDAREYASAWNFGPDAGGAVEVRAIVELLLEAWGGGSWRRCAPPASSAHEAGLLRLDSTKARNRLGWRAVLDLGEAVKLTVEWYKALGTKDMREVDIAQIDRYSAEWGGRRR